MPRPFVLRSLLIAIRTIPKLNDNGGKAQQFDSSPDLTPIDPRPPPLRENWLRLMVHSTYAWKGADVSWYETS